MKVVLIYRQSRKSSYSIEELFQTIAVELRQHIEVIEFVADSRWKLFHDIWRLKRLNADFFHITGDVNYFVIFLPRNKTVLTIHDTGHFVNGLKGVKRLVYKWIWFILPINMAGKVTAISKATQTSIQVDVGCKREHTRTSSMTFGIPFLCFNCQ